MEAKASANTLRISARKLRLVVDEVRGYDLREALDILGAMPKKGARMAAKAIASAGANAKVIKPEVEESRLFIKKIYVDEGPSLRRFMPKARGRGDRIIKRTSKLTVVVADE